MRRSVVWRALSGLVVVLTLLVFGVTLGSAAQFHGIAFIKGCDSPTNVGAAYTCSYQILNVVDGGHDTLRVTGLSDTVNAAGGAVSSGNILGSLRLVFSDSTVSCVGGTGAGTASNPYIGATSCLLPFGATIATNSFSFYTVQPADFNITPSHQLTDGASLGWNNTCTAPGVTNCTTNTQ